MRYIVNYLVFAYIWFSLCKQCLYRLCLTDYNHINFRKTTLLQSNNHKDDSKHYFELYIVEAFSATHHFHQIALGLKETFDIQTNK